jgi:hypothetical protein
VSEHTGRQAQRQAIAQWIFVGSGLVGAVIGASYAILTKLEIELSRGFLFGGSILLIFAVFAASVVYWRNIDEAAREAHKFAWFWGGVAGLLLMLPGAVLITSERLVAMFGPHSPAEWVLGGLAAMLIAQMAGYALVWAGWWLRQR